MLKSIYFSIICVILSVIFYGCKKEILTIYKTTYSGINANGKMLIFESVECFEKSIEFQTAENRKNLLNYLSKLKYNKYLTSNNIRNKIGNDSLLVMDDFLGQLLNEDGIVQIGSFIYKVNIQSQQVYVIPSEYSTEYQDLVNENILNKHIRQYSTNDEVLQLVENDFQSGKCNNPSASIEISTVIESGNALETKCYIKYFAAGIYFRVTGRTKKVGNYNNDYRYILECINEQTQIRRNPCTNQEVTIHEIGVKSNTLNNPEPIWEMYSKAWKVKNYTHISIRTRIEFYDIDVTLYRQTPTVVFILN